MTIAAYVLGVLGLLLAFLVALASGMKTVPRFTESDLLVALSLPALSVLLALLGLNLGGDVGRRPIANGGALILAGLTILFVLHSWAFQPSTPAIIQMVQKRLGIGDRWNPDTARWESETYVVEAEQGNSVQVGPGEREIVLEDGTGAVRWRRRLICRDQEGGVSSVVVSVDAVLSVLFDHCGLVVGDTLYMGMGDHLAAFSLPDFEKRWQLFPSTGGVYSLQSIESDVLAICGDGACRYDNEGTALWEASISPNRATGNFEIAEEVLTLQMTQGGTHRLSLATGESL